MSGEQQKKQRTRASPTTATTDTSLAKVEDPAGTVSTHKKGTGCFNSSRMGMTSACLKLPTVRSPEKSPKVICDGRWTKY